MGQLLDIMTQTKLALLGLTCTLCILNNTYAQTPNWSVNYPDFQNTMTAIISIADECIGSEDPNDIVAAFDLNGEIRGVEMTSVGNLAFLTIGSNGSGEEILFRIYDASSNAVYNAYSSNIIFIGDSQQGTISTPYQLNFDSSPEGVNAGPDVEVFNSTNAILDASGSGTWSMIQGTGGSILTPTDPKSQFAGNIGTYYTLAWTSDDPSSCIGETYEMTVFLVADEDEVSLGLCGDGLDNDGDGLYDCVDPDCDRPVVNSVSTVDPTAIDCNSTMANGMISLNQSNADQFSIDGGSSYQALPNFENLIAGNYDIQLVNSATGCQSEIASQLDNTFDPLIFASNIQISGPQKTCMNTLAVNYNINSQNMGAVSWSISLDAQIQGNGDNSQVDFGLTSNLLTANIAGVCAERTFTFPVEVVDNFACNFANCPDFVSLSTSIVSGVEAPHVYRAAIDMSSDAVLPSQHFEFTAGSSLELLSGFEVATGYNFRANIETCTK